MIAEKKQAIPTMILLNKGIQHKIYKVTAEAGMRMPEHISTKEAVVIVQEGSAILEINGSEKPLTKEDSFVIPAGVTHSLSIKEKFKSLVIMDNDSAIQFVD